MNGIFYLYLESSDAWKLVSLIVLLSSLFRNLNSNQKRPGHFAFWQFHRNELKVEKSWTHLCKNNVPQTAPKQTKLFDNISQCRSYLRFQRLYPEW